MAHAVPHVEQTLLKHPQRGDVCAQIKSQNLAEASQELHQHQAVGHGPARQDESGDPGELREGLQRENQEQFDQIQHVLVKMFLFLVVMFYFNHQGAHTSKHLHFSADCEEKCSFKEVIK